MKKIFTLAALLLTVANLTFAQTKVGMLVANDYTNSGDENAAVQWFQTNYTDGVLVTPSSLSTTDLSGVKTLWVACDRIGIAQGWTNLPGNLAADATINALKTFVENGGNLLLTNHATQLTVAVGRIADNYKPGIYGSGEGGQNSDAWGSNAIIGYNGANRYDHTGHPVYKNLTSENRTDNEVTHPCFPFIGSGHKGDHNCMWDLNAYGLAANPDVVKTWEDLTNSTVLGTWQQVLDYCCAGIVDFEPTTAIKGRILAVGLAAYEWDMNGDANTYQSNMEQFTKNCLTYLTEGGEEVVPQPAADTPMSEGLAAVEGKMGLFIGYESIDDIADDDEKAAAQWFQTTFSENGIIITPNTINNIAQVKTLWVAIDRAGLEAGAANLPSAFISTDAVEAMTKHVKDGGSLLLTNHAVQLLTTIGRLDGLYAPGIFGGGEGGENNDTWGINAMIGCNPDLENHYDHSAHAIFTGLRKNNSLYADHSFFPLIDAGWKEDHNCKWDFNNAAYGLEDNPNKMADFENKTNSVILGAWQHVTDYACAGLIEFKPEGDYKGTVIANGLAAYEWKKNAGTNEYQPNIEQLTQNSLYYLNSVATKTPATAISTTLKAQGSAADEAIYTLDGRRVSQPKAGVYIKNNKKYVVK